MAVSGLVALHGDAYAPVFERIEEELHNLRRRTSAVDIRAADRGEGAGGIWWTEDRHRLAPAAAVKELHISRLSNGRNLTLGSEIRMTQNGSKMTFANSPRDGLNPIHYGLR
jgi:hypothetical protein